MPAITKAITKANALAQSRISKKRMQHPPHMVRKFWGIMTILVLGVAATYALRPTRPKSATPLMATDLQTTPPANGIAKTAALVKASSPAADPELEDALRSAPIKAITEGSSPRVLIGTKIIGVGEEITGGLVLIKIENKTLFARDEAGAIYTRIY